MPEFNYIYGSHIDPADLSEYVPRLAPNWMVCDEDPGWPRAAKLVPVSLRAHCWLPAPR